jgi:hypothetical protein
MRRYLLVEPQFPIPNKSKNHKDFLPIGLLKIARYLHDQGNYVILVRGTQLSEKEEIYLKENPPEEIWVTSLFTYWASYVKDSVQYYKKKFPKSKIIVGGIYASLLPPEEVITYTGCDRVYQGVIPEVEEYSIEHFPLYNLIEEKNSHPVDYQILHTSRGCPRKCPFCGTWKVEPEFVPKKTIKAEIRYPKIIFYDNNFLMNPNIESILTELRELKNNGALKWVESQSGLDGRILLEKPYLAKMLKKSGFRNPRIAWDWGFTHQEKIEQQIQILVDGGFSLRNIYIFMLYNHDLPFYELEKKRIACWEWGVQIVDCRFRPLHQIYDNYSPNKRHQDDTDYYIHENWTDEKIRLFRRNIRRQNICIRYNLNFYSRSLEKKCVPKDISIQLRKLSEKEEIIRVSQMNNIDYWFPDNP